MFKSSSSHLDFFTLSEEVENEHIELFALTLATTPYKKTAPSTVVGVTLRLARVSPAIYTSGGAESDTPRRDPPADTCARARGRALTLATTPYKKTAPSTVVGVTLRLARVSPAIYTSGGAESDTPRRDPPADTCARARACI